MESPRGGGALGSRGYKEAKKGEGIVCAGGWVGGVDGAMLDGDGGVRIMVVKLLFPPGEKKGVNDTLELPTPTRCSSLSFMEGERHTQALLEVRRPGRQPCRPTAPLAGGFNKKEGWGGGAITVIIITKYNIKQSVRGHSERDPPLRPHAHYWKLCWRCRGQV